METTDQQAVPWLEGGEDRPLIGLCPFLSAQCEPPRQGPITTA